MKNNFDSDVTLGDLERIAERRDENLRVERNPAYTKAWFV